MDEEHGYGYSKRHHVYRFLAEHLGLSLETMMQSNGSISEKEVVLQPFEDLLVFNERLPRPDHVLGSGSPIEFP